MTQWEKLVALIKSQKEAVGDQTKPVVSLEEFFEGNDDYGSIGCNLDGPCVEPAPAVIGWQAKVKAWLGPKLPATQPAPTAPHPGPQGFYQILKAVRERDDVQEVLVEIDDYEGLDWPFSEVVYVLTSAFVQEVEGWVKDLFPDEVAEGYFGEKPARAPALRPGYRVYSVWWD